MKRLNLQLALCGARWSCSLVFKTSDDKNKRTERGKDGNKCDRGETGSILT